MTFTAPEIDYAGLAPVFALTAGICVVLMSAVFERTKRIAPVADPGHPGSRTAVSASGNWVSARISSPERCGWTSWRSRSALIAILTAAVTVLLSIGEPAVEQAGLGRVPRAAAGLGAGDGAAGAAQNLVAFFIAIETLSIPLYVLCATDLRRPQSLESGLKYLIIGSLGSATLLYGLASSTALRARPTSPGSPPESASRACSATR